MVNFLLKKFSNFSNIFVNFVPFNKFVKFSLIFSLFFLFLGFAPVNFVDAAACNATGTGTWGGASDTASFTSCTGSAANGSGTGNRPAATDTVTINAGVALTLAGNVQVAGITVAANTANTTSLTLTGFTLTNTGTLVCTVPGSNNITTTIAIGTGTLNNTGLITLNAAATGKVCSITMSTGTITLGAGITFSGSTPVFNNSAAGTINLNGGTFGSGGTVTINSGTALNVGGTSTLSQAKTFGAVNINSGTLTLGVASVVFGSTTNIADGATLRLGNFAFTQTGALTVGTGTSGTVQVAAAGSTGSYTFSNAITVNAGGTFNLSTGTHAVVLGGTGTITHNGATFNTGTGAITYSGTGAKAFAGSSNMTFGGTMTVLSGRTLTNSKSAGTLTIGALTMASPTATNSFTLATNSVTTVTGALTFTANTTANNQTITLQGTANLNAGSIVGTGAPTSTGSSRILCDTAASGTLTVTGTVSMTGNSTSTGSKYIDMSAGSCNFSVGSTLTLTGGTNATGDAEVIMGTGTLTMSAGLTFASTTANAKLTTTGAGIINLTGTMTGAGTVSINSAGTFNTSGTTALSTAATFPTLNVLSGTTTLGAVAITISGATNITGALSNATSATLKTFSGLVTINSGGSVALTSGTNPAITFGAGIVASSGAGSINWGTGATTFSATQAFTGSSNMTFGGSTTISSGFTLTNSNTGVITFNNAVTGGNASSNFATSTDSYTKFGSTVMATGIITPTYTSQTVEYSGGAQSIKNPTTNNYYHLILSGTGAKTLTGITQTMGDFSVRGIASATTTTSFFSVAGNLSTAGDATLTLGGNLTVSGALNVGDNTNASALITGNFTLDVTGITTIYAGSFVNHAGNAAITLNNNLVVTGCLSAAWTCSSAALGTGTITVNGSVTGSGTITLSGGTFEVRPAAGASFASAVSSANWKFKNLTFSNSTGSPITVTTQNGGTGTIEVTTTLSIGKAGDTGATVLSAGDRTWKLSGAGTALAMLDSPAATLTGATSTFKYAGTSAMNVAASTSGGGTVSYNNLSLIAPGVAPTYTLGTTSGQTLSVGGDMVLGDGVNSMTVLGSTNNPTINVTGNYTSNGNAAFTSTSGTFSVGGDFTNGATFTHNSGTVALTSASTATISSTNNMTFNNFTVSGIGAAKTVKFKHHTTNIPIFTFAGTVTLDGASGQVLTIDSDDGVNQWLAHFNNAVSPTWVSVQNSGCHAGSANATVDGNSSLNSNNGSCWPGAGITISGVIRLANGSSAYDCSADNQTVAIKVNGAGSYSGTCTLNTGVFSVSYVSVASAGDVISLFLDNETYDAVTVTRAADTSSNITGIELWALHVIVRHEDAGPITNANLDQFDSVQDADVSYTVTTNNLTVDDGMRLYMWDGKTYTPGGTITTSPNSTSDPYDGSLVVGTGATFNAGSNAMSIGGSLFLSYGTFTVSSGQTITLTATSAILTNYGGNTLENLVFDGVGGSWTLLDDLTTTGDVIVTNGTLNVGSVNLVIPTGKQLTVGASGTLNGGSGIIGLYGSGSAGSRPFIVTGTFTPGTGSVGYAGTSATDIEATTYNNLYLMPAGSPTYTLGTAGSQTINVNDLVVGTGTSGHAIQVNQTVYHPVLNITGNFTINDYVGGWTDNGVEVINAKPNGTKNWVHTNFTDCVGVVNLASGTNTPKILMTGDICVAKMNIAASHELDLSSHVMYLAWSGTGASRPFINNGTFTPSTGRVDYSTGGATDIEATTYYDLSVGEYADSNADTYTLIGNTTVQNALTIGNASSTNSDTLSQGASYNLITGAVTVTSRGIWSNIGTGDIVLSGGVSNAGTIILNSNNGVQCVDGADDIVITSSVGGTQRAWSGAGTFAIYNVNYTDMTGAGVTAYTSTASNSTWTVGVCGITISGTIYSDEGSTAITSGPTIRIKVNGAGSYSAAANGSGVYSIANVTIGSAGDVITVFIDNATPDGVVITRATNTSSNITGLNIYQNRVIVRHEDAGPITNANLDQYDSGGDADIPFTVTTSNLTVGSGTKLLVWTGKTFTPGGTVTTTASSTAGNPDGDLGIQVSATLTMATNALSVGGDFTNEGTLSVSSGQTTTFTATGTGFTITHGTGEFDAMTFNGTGGEWTLQDSSSPTGNVTVTAGTFKLGVRSLTMATTAVLTVGASGTLNGGSGHISLYKTGTGASRAFINNGAFTTGTSWFGYYADGDMTIETTNVTYYDLDLSSFENTVDANYTANGALNVTNDLVTDPYSSGAVYRVTLTLGGNLSVTGILNFAGSSNGRSTLNTTASNYSVAAGSLHLGLWGTFTANNSTVTVTGAVSTDGTFTGGTGTHSFGSVLITDGTFNATAGTMTVSGNWTHTGSGTFTHNSGTVISTNTNATWNVAINETFYNLTLNAGGMLTISSGDTLIVTNTYTATAGGINTGTVEARGNVTIGSSSTSGSGTVSFLVAGDQVVTNSGGGGIGKININKPSGTVSITGGNLTADSFTLSSGVFTSTSGNLNVAGSWTHTAGGTFNHNNGTVTFSFNNATWDFASTETFYNFTVNSGGTLTISSGDTLVVTNTFTATADTINGGTVEAQGNVVIGSGFNGGTTALTLTGSVAQTITNSGGTAPTGLVTINKTNNSDTITLASNYTFAGGLTVTKGVFSQGASYNLTTAGTLTVSTNGTWSNIGTGDVVLGGAVANAGAIILNSNNGTQCADGTDDIVVTSSVGGTQRAWSGAGTFTIYNVNYTDMTGAGVTAYTSTASNSTWTVGVCGITISGTVYTNEGVTLLTSGPTFRVKINGAGSYSAVADGSGVYSISAITASASDVVTVYLDTNGGAKAVLVTRASGSDMTGMNLYQNFVIVRSDDGGALTNTNMDSYDSVNDTDINFTVTTGNLTVLTGNTFYMQSGTYTPGGNITQAATSSFKQVGGTFNGGSGSITINGNFTLTGGTFNSTTGNLTVLSDWTHTVGGTFVHNNGLVTTTGIIANTWDVSTSETFYDLNINRGSGFTLTIASGDTLIVTHTFTHSNNSRLGTGTVEVRGSMVVTNSNTSPGDATISFLVAGDQTITATSGHMDKLNINKPSGTVSITGDLEVASVTLGSTSILTSTTGTLTVDGNWTNTAGGVFNHNNGTVAATTATASTWDFNSTETFYNFNLNKVSGWTVTFGASDSMIVLNNYTATDGYMQSPVEVRGNIIYTTNADGGSGAFTLTGSAAQTITVSGSGVLPTGLLTINKTNNSDTVTLASNVTLGGAITVTKGVFSQGASFNIRTAGTFTVSANGTWSNIGTGDIILGGNVSNAGTVTISSSNAAECTDVTDDIVITSTAGTRTWNGAGTYTIRNVDVTNMTDGAITITVYNSTLTSTDWTVGVCGITISGTIYSDEGSTAITSGPTIRIKVNGAGSYSAVADGSGVYSVSAVTIGSAGDVITVFVDNATPDGVVVTRAANTSSNITGLNLYQNRVIVRHEDAGPITNANLDQYDSGGDADIPFTVTTSNLTVGSGTKLLVWTGKTFTPGGTVTTTASATSGNPDGDVLIQASAVVNTGTSTWTIGGDFSNLGTYTVTASQNTYFTATSTGFTVDDGSSEFDGLLFNGIGGSWTLQSNSSPTGNVSVLDGTLNVGTTTLSVAAAKTLTISGSGSTIDGGSGIINLASTATPLSISAGTFTGSSGTVNFTGNGATIACTGATYNILNLKPSSSTAQILCTGASQTLTAGTVTVGDSTNAGASGATNNPAINISGVLTVALNATFTPGAGTITLSGSGTPFVNNGTFTQGASTFVYSGTSATNITAATYNNLYLLPAGTVTYTLGTASAQTLTANDISVGDDVNGVTFKMDTYNPNLNILGNLNIYSNSTFTKGSGTITFKKGGTQYFHDFENYTDIGNVVVAANGVSNTTLVISGNNKLTRITVDASQTLDFGGGWNLYITGSGTAGSRPLIVNGSFNPSHTGVVQWSSTSATDIEPVDYNSIIFNAAGPFNMPATSFHVTGNFTIVNGATINKAAGTIIFDDGVANNIDDQSTVKQDLGGIQVSARTTNTTLTILSNVKVTTAIIDASQTVALNANTLTLTGNTTPFTVTGTLTPNVGTIEFASAATTGTTVPAVTYYGLKLNKSGNTFVVSAGNLIVNGNLDIVAGGLDLNANDPVTTVAGATTIVGTLNASSTANFSFGGDFINNGTFTHNNGTVVVAPGSSFTSLLIGGSTNTNFYNFTANHSNLAGKNIQFKNGAIFSVAHNLTMAGSSFGGNLLIDSDSLGSAWKIFVDTEAVANLDSLIVRDSHCEVGTKVFDLPSTVSNAGNNDPCWPFVNFGIVQPIDGSGFGTLRTGGTSGRASQNDNEGGGSGGGQPQGGGGQGGPPGGGGASVIDAVQGITWFSFSWLFKIWHWLTS